MTDKKIDEMLKTLANPRPSGELNDKLKEKLRTEYAERGKTMKKYGIKRTIVIAAACCMLFSTAAIASTRIVKYSVSHSTPKEFTKYEELEKVKEKTGLNIKAPESFENGYTFMEASIIHGSDIGEAEEVIDKFEGIDVRYQNDGDDGLFLNTSPASRLWGEERKPTEKTTIEGIEVLYYLDTYKNVPPDYRPTKEEEERMETDKNFYISYGSDKIEENQISSCLWVQDGISYDLLNINSAMSAEEMFAMAREIITWRNLNEF